MSSHQKSHRRLPWWVTLGHRITITTWERRDSSLQTMIFPHCLPLHPSSQTPAPERVRGQQRPQLLHATHILWTQCWRGDTLGALFEHLKRKVGGPGALPFVVQSCTRNNRTLSHLVLDCPSGHSCRWNSCLWSSEPRIKLHLKQTIFHIVLMYTAFPEIQYYVNQKLPLI